MEPAQPNSSLLAAIDWSQVSRTAAREVLNREAHSPAVSAFRWWARRPHSVIGALLEVAVDRFGPELLVADPFSGGGTVAFEAARRGLRTYAQDLYPWPTYGLATTLAWVNEPDFVAAATELQRRLEPYTALYRRPDGRSISHMLRIRRTRCATCASDFFDLPSPMLSLRSRTAGEKQAFYCCAGCGAVSARTATVKRFRCDCCGLSQSGTAAPSNCPHCGHPKKAGPLCDGHSRWVPALVSEVATIQGRCRTHLRLVEPGDPVGDIAVDAPQSLRARILPGQETNRLLAAGFARWADLYSGRQLEIFVGALKTVKQLDASDALKDRLALAVLGAAEMPAFTSRWDRFHLKPFEGLANHRYSCGPVAVECNPLSPVGRGTLPRRLASAQKALHWLQADKAKRSISTRQTSTRGPYPKGWDVLVATGSSEQQALPDRSVNLVLTDPPYHDDVQYGELARLFHAWLRAYQPIPPVREDHEAVPNTYRGGALTFERTIAACLEESHRTLRRDGVLLLTFHNKALAAWQGLARALHKSGFAIRALAVVHAENGNDHCKRNVDAMLHDLVIECVKRTGRVTEPTLEFDPDSVPRKNLAAMGLALASAVRSGDTESIQEAYWTNLSALKGRKRLIK